MLTQESAGYNLFAYCNNNPVNMSDPSGHVGQSIHDYFYNTGCYNVVDHGTWATYTDKNGKKQIWGTKPKAAAENMPGFKWNDGKPGFSVPTDPAFLSKQFCMTIADDFIKNYGTDGQYAGLSATDIAAECHAHAIMFYPTEVTKNINIGTTQNESTRVINIDPGDHRINDFLIAWYASWFYAPFS